ncbi:Lactaldehyde dehydrogenase [uncultured archaeon]|nr:Lactaldehyde dehydrogenase [uncultured archaeon]
MTNVFFPTEQEIPDKYKVSPVNQTKYLIGGELREWSGARQEVLSPICIRDGDKIEQKVLGSYPMLTPEESMQALDAAVKAYDNGKGVWPTMPVEGRIKHVEGFLERMTAVRSDVVNLLMWEIGKTYPDSAKEFDRTVEYVKDTIKALKGLDEQSSRFQREGGIMAQIRRAPLGKVLCMGPYNYPLNETYTTLIPALIMGNTVVFKPSKYGVLLHEPLLKAYQESFPPGVLNTIYGDGKTIIGPMMKSGNIDVLAFIGSCGVSNAIERQHPKPNRLRCVLGLGAKNPGIVLKDADLESAVNECVQGSLSYNGQRCTALKVLFVEREIADEFVKKFSEKVDGLGHGMPWQDKVTITPLPEAGKTQYLDDLVKDAQINGAGVVNLTGRVIDHTFFSPAVLYPVNSKMKVYHEEQFGPVVPIVPFDNISEPLEYMDNSEVGQQASIFGKDPEVIGALIDPLVNQVCRVNLNSQCQRGPDSFPFTGRKDSAEGTLSITDALRVFSIRTLVAAKESPQNKEILRGILKGTTSQFLSTDVIL